MTKTKAYLGRPENRTFEAYVKFMDAMIGSIAPNAKRTLTEEQRKANWKLFWEKVDELDKKK